MTWNVSIVATGVESVPGGNVCGGCKHSDGCQIHKVAGPMQDLLTGVDTRCDGKWANGEAVLTCHGFEAKETPAPSEDKAGEDKAGEERDGEAQPTGPPGL